MNKEALWLSGLSNAAGDGVFFRDEEVQICILGSEFGLGAHCGPALWVCMWHLPV